MTKTVIKASKLVIDQGVSAPMIFTFRGGGGRTQGRLEVYKRSVTWYPRRGVQGYTLRVDQLDRVFEESGRKKRKRK